MHSIIPKEAQAVIAPSEKLRPKYEVLVNGGEDLGTPIGGIGAGSIGRSASGHFNRYSISPGRFDFFTESANIFSVYQKQTGRESFATALADGYQGKVLNEKPLQRWYKNTRHVSCEHKSLYPVGWFHYKPNAKMDVEMICEQFSPVIKNNYKESSLPLGVFRWRLKNTGDKETDVALMLSFVNMNGWFTDSNHAVARHLSSGLYNEPFNSEMTRGVMLRRETTDPHPPNQGSMCIGLKKEKGITITTRSTFHGDREGDEIWDDFASKGEIHEGEDWTGCCEFSPYHTGYPAGAVCGRVTLQPGEERELLFALSWDFPVVTFGGGRSYFRRYTKYFGTDGENAGRIVDHACKNHRQWFAKIRKWQKDILRQTDPITTSLLFNELYLLNEGATVWLDKAVHKRAKAEGLFAILECCDYPHYNTLDLWIYASIAIFQNWPRLSRKVISFYADAVLKEDARLMRRMRYAPAGDMIDMQTEDTCMKITVKGQAPHDLGSPFDDPIHLVNSYNFQETNDWKDLNSQFILAAYREIQHSTGKKLINRLYPSIVGAFERLATYDKDGDGLIENEGKDQTFDMIGMFGAGAYCSGLWLAALCAVNDLAEKAGDTSTVKKSSKLLKKARKSFIQKLWTGEQFAIDEQPERSDIVFIDQCFGLWYADTLGLKHGIKKTYVKKALRHVFDRNYVKDRGVVNISGFGRDERNIDKDGGQTDEFLIGINLCFAAQLKFYNLKSESSKVLQAIHSCLYERNGLMFKTPAAVGITGNYYRAVRNMRPLGVWALALDSKREKTRG